MKQLEALVHQARETLPPATATTSQMARNGINSSATMTEQPVQWHAKGTAITPAALSEDETEVARVMQICNACRYCEGFCAVFPAMTRRLEFGKADINYLASSEIGFLVTIKRRIDRRKGQLVMFGVSPYILDIFQTMNLHKVLDIVENRASALSKLKS